MGDHTQAHQLRFYTYISTKQIIQSKPNMSGQSNGADIPKKHRAAIYDNPGKVSTKVVEVDTPEPGPGQVLIRLSASGICHSDFGVMTNSWKILPHPTQAGQVGGHEGVGRIVKMGPGTESSAAKVGQKVGVKWISAICNSCPACLAGHDGVCFNQKISGYYTPGTFQEYVTAPHDYCTPVPEELDSAAAAPMLCAGVTVYSALKKSGTQAGDWVVFFGAGGGLGHLACQIAARGLGLRVIGIDHPSKKDLVLQSGAEHFISHSDSKDVGADVKGLTGGLGAKAALVLTSANAAYASAMTVLSFGGTLVCVGIPEGELKPIATAFPGPMLQMEQRIVGSAVGNRREAIEVLDMAARGLVKTHYKTVKMDQLTSVFEDMEQGKIQGRVVLDLQ